MIKHTLHSLVAQSGRRILFVDKKHDLPDKSESLRFVVVVGVCWVTNDTGRGLINADDLHILA